MQISGSVENGFDPFRFPHFPPADFHQKRQDQLFNSPKPVLEPKLGDILWMHLLLVMRLLLV